MRKEFQGFERVGRQISTERAVSGCFGKKPFDGKNQARDHARTGTKRYGNYPQTPYKCHICGLWHLTSVPKAKQAKTRRKDWIVSHETQGK